MEEIINYVKNKKESLKEAINKLSFKIKLVIIQVNDDPASNSYIKGKLKDCNEIGIIADLIKLPIDVKEEELLSLIDKLNNDNSVTGIIVQLPLPETIDAHKVSLRIDPTKDVDGFHPLSLYKPATPLGIVTFLEDNNFDFKGKNAVVVGRSKIVGKPIAKLLLEHDMNVTVLHSKTSLEDLKFYLKNADLAVISIGKAHFIDKKFKFKKDAVLIDVGISRNELGKLEGDCLPNLKVKFQSPVPKGVGLLTRLALLINLYHGGIKNGF